MSTKKRFYIDDDRGTGFKHYQTALCDRERQLGDDPENHAWLHNVIASIPEEAAYLEELCVLLNKGHEATEAPEDCPYCEFGLAE